MKLPNSSIFAFFVLLLICACSNTTEEVDSVLNENINHKIQKGKNIKIIYSDSAKIKLVIHSPEIERYLDINNGKDFFPKGILLEFLDKNKNVLSWLKAETALREERTKKITAKGNVVFYNNNNEKLETPELIFDEVKRIVYTDKLIRISQAEKGDTTYGFGFIANQDFTVFEIKKKVQGKINVSDFVTQF